MNNKNVVDVTIENIKNSTTFVELFYRGEIELKWYTFSYTEKALDYFLHNVDPSKKDEQIKVFKNLCVIYNDYIIHKREAELFTSFNELYLADFFDLVLKKTNIDSLLWNNYNTKKEKEFIFDSFNIISNILNKYIKYKTSELSDFSFILSRHQLNTLADIILNAMYYLKTINKSRLNPNEQFILKELYLLTLTYKDVDNIEQELLYDSNILSIQINNNFLLYDTIFYIEFLTNIDKVLNLKTELNKTFIKKVYKKIKKRIDSLTELNIDWEDINTINNTQGQLIELETLLNNLIDKYKIKIDKWINIDKSNDNKVSNSSVTKKTITTKEKKNNKENIVELNKKLIKLYKRKDIIKKDLKNKILGQNEIIDWIIDDSIKKLLLWFNKRPISILLAGDSWLGKTELAKQIGITLWWKSLHIPMWNYKHEHTDASFLWAPPWYIGNDENTVLEKYIISCQEECKVPVIIFDEIEKGHISLQNMYLELLDEWKLTFQNWNVYDLTKSIIIMTSNLWINEINKKSIWFWIGEDEDIIQEVNLSTIRNAIKAFFRPEILNRISNIYIFNSLSDKNIRDIITNTIKNSIKHIKQNIILKDIFWKKIDEVKLVDIKKELSKIVKLNNMNNIRKIESETENIIIKLLEQKK